MIKTIILEDEKEAMATLKGYIEKFAKESGQAISVECYFDAVKFLEDYSPSKADIIFFDIQMPTIDGMRAAKKIRERDENVIIIFVTNLAQYAVEGYAVQAYDFILKPVRYTGFKMKMTRICNRLEYKRDDYSFNINGKDGMRRVFASDVLYMEVINHDVIIHTADDDEIKTRSTLSSFANDLKSKHFALCNSCYLVNLKHVRSVKGEYVTVGKDQLRISQPKRKAFLQEVASYFGGSVK